MYIPSNVVSTVVYFARKPESSCCVVCFYRYCNSYYTVGGLWVRRRPGCRYSMGRCAPNHDEVNAPFSPVPLAMYDRSVLHSNGVFAIVLGIFRV